MAVLALTFVAILGSVVPSGLASPDSLFRVRAAQAPSPPTVDGVLADGEWDSAAVAGDFIQYEPRRGDPATTRTQALMMYDAGHLFVAFRVWDPEPPTAQLTRRDADLLADDAVMLLLDSHYDRQSAYYFITNLLGTQADGRVANDGRTVDPTWDATWLSAASATDFGWTVEITIPFTSIKYAAGEGRTWGVNFGRSQRRNLELSFWAGPLENQYRVSQAGIITQLDVAPPARRHQVIVYGLSQFQQDTTPDWDAGLDARYALTPSLAALATINPDFATVEADQERVNLTRFELFLPEKRPFFMEGAELYRQRIRTFYSRRIPDITAGAQVLGKQGPWTLATIGARSVPFGDSTVGTYAVVRAQRDILGSSNAAVMLANRTLSRVNQGSVGMDATLFFTRTVGMTAQAAHSWGPGAGGTWAYFLRPAYDSPTTHFHVRYTHLGERFADNVNVIGFIRDDDRRELDGALEHTFWSGSGIIERLVYDSNYNIYWSQTGVLRSWQIDQELEVDFRNRLSVELAYTEEFKGEWLPLFKKDFRNRRIGLELGYNTREFQSARIGLQIGRNFDSDFQLWTVAAAYKVTSGLSVEYDLEHLTLDPDPENESTWIHVIRADQFFTTDLFLRVFFQKNTAIDRTNIQAVFVYRYRPPFGTLQLVYQRGTAEFGERSEQGNTFFLKATVVF
ncbi:MAG: carbohydrate binding family 9 domain-containing protein [Planctomycetota bacterium]|jgi:hypothetical protein